MDREEQYLNQLKKLWCAYPLLLLFAGGPLYLEVPSWSVFLGLLAISVLISASYWFMYKKMVYASPKLLLQAISSGFLSVLFVKSSLLFIHNNRDIFIFLVGFGLVGGTSWWLLKKRIGLRKALIWNEKDNVFDEFIHRLNKETGVVASGAILYTSIAIGRRIQESAPKEHQLALLIGSFYLLALTFAYVTANRFVYYQINRNLEKQTGKKFVDRYLLMVKTTDSGRGR